MPIVHTTTTVANTATLIATIPIQTPYVAISIQNNDSASIFVGDSTTTTTGANKGHVVAAGATYQLWCNAGDTIYAISAAGTAANAVSVLYSKVI